MEKSSPRVGSLRGGIFFVDNARGFSRNDRRVRVDRRREDAAEPFCLRSRYDAARCRDDLIAPRALSAGAVYSRGYGRLGGRDFC